TYPLEVVEAYQWLQQNRNLQGQDLANAAKQQNWDASIQALVAFPDALKLLNDDIRWTTDLGNAFLGQQADVMAAVQRLRAQAQQSGKLNSNPEVNVATQTENGQSAIEIQPANPQVVYVPVYNPAFFWGTLYPYPPLFYPAIGVGWGFGAGISLGFFFGAGCCGWGGWGWGPSWFGHTVIVNNEFFHRYGFNHFNGGGWGRGVWRHDPAHRLGVPYADHRMTEHFRSAGRAPAIRRSGGELRNAPRFNGPSERTGNHMIPERSNNHGIFGGVTNGARVRVQSDHGFSSMRSAGRGSGGARGSGGHPSGGPRGGRR
ncbi:MAG TPA: DUF3300 domain-containing protein, partial [Bryobacteraceae bacterium]|nr:DUF3300 domain-containing protein [Bryobacteraceae bacterium]